MDNQLINATLLLITYTDQSHGVLGQKGNPLMWTYYDYDENWYSALCQVFSCVYRYDLGLRASHLGLVGANEDIINVAEMYHPKYMFYPAGSYDISTDTLMRLREIGCIVVGRFEDDDYRFDDHSKWLIPYLDYCITNVPGRVPQYEALGARCIPLPIEGHNEAIWQRLPHIPKKFDVSFAGLVYPHRHKLLESLRGLGIPVQVFDNTGGGNLLSLRDLVWVINATRINLNLTLDRYVPGLRQTKGRPFEITLSGGFVLTEYAPDLEKYFEIDRELVCFEDIKEAAQKIEYYLSHPDEREAIAERGYMRACRDYTTKVVYRDLFLRIEDDLNRHGRAVPERESTVALKIRENPLRKNIAERHYQWGRLLFSVHTPLHRAWRETIEVAIQNDPYHRKARLALTTYGARWYIGDKILPFIRLASFVKRKVLYLLSKINLRKKQVTEDKENHSRDSGNDSEKIPTASD